MSRLRFTLGPARKPLNFIPWCQQPLAILLTLLASLTYAVRVIPIQTGSDSFNIALLASSTYTLASSFGDS